MDPWSWPRADAGARVYAHADARAGADADARAEAHADAEAPFRTNAGAEAGADAEARKAGLGGEWICTVF